MASEEDLISLAVVGALSGVAYWSSNYYIPALGELFIKAHLFGRDLNKSSDAKVPEALGVVAGMVFLVTRILYLVVSSISELAFNYELKRFSHDESAVHAIALMLFLGFADDVLNLKWRHKIVLSTLASFPLVTSFPGSTKIIFPKPVRGVLGTEFDVGILYYIYMSMLAVFCTNAINILAGVNGLEAGQTIVIAASVLAFNLVECFVYGNAVDQHLFSIFLFLPFIAVTAALLKHNWYPSRVFVGDTFCYFAGMTFAAAGILGIFSKTLLLFFIPQVLNFLYSVPQLFHIIPCPRHRMPRVNAQGLLGMSFTEFNPDELGGLGQLIVNVVRMFRLAHVEKIDDGKRLRMNNLTLINFVLYLLGPVHEQSLTIILLFIQLLGTCMAFAIRYPLAWMFY
eukprot:scpid72565/ scgid25771/ UDP-N-acetylglucosamine--dolichyl-phosphate N-acetylglucosaminephosphotransferase; GlcNAc-1-P transferase; N-acetylglucosamine-1-phosphate transferase